VGSDGPDGVSKRALSGSRPSRPSTGGPRAARLPTVEHPRSWQCHAAWPLT
jgi:hypothetical protein